MYKVILVIHIMAAIALIVAVLAQRSSSDGMGLSGNSSSSLLSGRAAASFATRMTTVLALIFILTSLSLGVITARGHIAATSIADKVKAKTSTTPAAPTPDAAPAGKSPVPDASPAMPANAPANNNNNNAPAVPAPATTGSVPRPQ